METIFETEDKIRSLKDASQWASNYLKKNVTESNIAYLVNYGRINKAKNNGSLSVDISELKNYYDSYFGRREVHWKNQLGEDLNWHLSFDFLKEADTTKHVHRLHPYKGKFIPQLVEYFIDDHTDEFKTDVFFHKGDIILDPFCGSGTTLVQSNELGMNAIGIDISAFNALISNVKIGKYNLFALREEIEKITRSLRAFHLKRNILQFDAELTETLSSFDNEFFPSPEYKQKVLRNEIDENSYGQMKSDEFLTTYWKLIQKYGIALKQSFDSNFLEKWYLQPIRDEIDFVFTQIKSIQNIDIKKAISIIFSRTIRSCRATTHTDLATLIEPVTTTYYCAKHGKICKPLFTILNWWERYSKDTIVRLSTFNKLRTETCQYCLVGDSRVIDIVGKLENKCLDLASLVRNKKIDGIFSSPPYVGLIDYHEQHAYAYDLFRFERNDESEIGPLYKGNGKEARESYVQGISDALINCKKFLKPDYNVFLVANDKYGIYPMIAEKAGMKIVNRYRRPVLNRSEKDKGAYSEIIFHMTGSE
ncbi:MAG: DNA methyltransferase [Candidatus Marinimicrobia bacterium]|nr:DNA methyltransferase [Candidatus Neomarinimicrobiota bacterium]